MNILFVPGLSIYFLFLLSIMDSCVVFVSDMSKGCSMSSMAHPRTTSCLAKISVSSISSFTHILRVYVDDVSKAQKWRLHSVSKLYKCAFFSH